MNKSIFITFLPVISIFFFSFNISIDHIEKISLRLKIQTVDNGNLITSESTTYYRLKDGLLVTVGIIPDENITIINAKGELKTYNSTQNSVLLMNDEELSSKRSFFYYFLNSKDKDMGLPTDGYKLLKTKIEGNIVVTKWKNEVMDNPQIAFVELAHANNSCIYTEYLDKNSKTLQKVYYSKFASFGSSKLPLLITEFNYMKNGDSVITRKTYSDLKINEQVESKYLNFKIPDNAKLVSPKN